MRTILPNSNGQADDEDDEPSAKSEKLSEICSRLSEPARNGDNGGGGGGRGGGSGSDSSSSDDDDSYGNSCPPPPPPRTQLLNHQADAVAGRNKQLELSCQV